jgi:hypothetical protein
MLRLEKSARALMSLGQIALYATMLDFEVFPGRPR